MSHPTPPILPYATPEGIKEFVPLEDYNHLRIARDACERQYQEKVSELLFVMHERDEARAAIAELNGRLIERTSGMLSKQTELTQEARKARSLARRAVDYLDKVAEVFQATADDRRFSFRDRSNMEQCARRIRTEVKPLRDELEAFDALPVRPNAAECGQCADNGTFHLAPGEG